MRRIMVDATITIDIDEAMDAKLAGDATQQLDVELTLGVQFKQLLGAEQVDILTITREDEHV